MECRINTRVESGKIHSIGKHYKEEWEEKEKNKTKKNQIRMITSVLS